MTVQWADPPPPPKTVLYVDVVAELQTRPGQWAIIATLANAQTARVTALRIRRGELAAFRPAGHFEAETRVTEDGTRIYARYTGGAS